MCVSRVVVEGNDALCEVLERSSPDSCGGIEKPVLPQKLVATDMIGYYENR
jgi:hypothetical protein